MKKLLTLVCAIVMLFAFATSASAWGFSISGMQCTNPVDTDVRYANTFGLDKYIDDKSIYVAHSVDGVNGATDTNMLHAVRRTNGSGSVLAAKKWVTPVGGGGIPIQGNAIYSDYNRTYTYSLAGRGNTNYQSKYGFSNITIRGSFYTNGAYYD